MFLALDTGGTHVIDHQEQREIRFRLIPFALLIYDKMIFQTIFRVATTVKSHLQIQSHYNHY